MSPDVEIEIAVLESRRQRASFVTSRVDRSESSASRRTWASHRGAVLRPDLALHVRRLLTGSLAHGTFAGTKNPATQTPSDCSSLILVITFGY